VALLEEVDAGVHGSRGYDAARGDLRQRALGAVEKAKALVRPLSAKHRFNARYVRAKLKQIGAAGIDERLRRAEAVTGVRLVHRILMTIWSLSIPRSSCTRSVDNASHEA
jgi:hypothetical protein